MGGKRYALNIGLSNVDEYYYGKNHPLISGPKVADYLDRFFSKRGFDNLSGGPWIDSEATAVKFEKRLEYLSQELVSGDLLVLSFCGHTFRIKKEYDFLENHKNEDEGWVFYDRVVFHFEIWAYAKKFKPGVQIIVISDSCYSGSMESHKAKLIDIDHSRVFWNDNKSEYNKILVNSASPMQHEVPPTVVVISASAENEKAMEMPVNGRRTYFSEAFDLAWKNKKKMQSLSIFFDDLNWELFKIVRLRRRRHLSSAQWHYYQGHAYTKLINRAPFKL